MIIKSLKIQCLPIGCLTIQSVTMIQSLTSKTRFFELFIENKNLIKQGLYLLEICQNTAGSTNHATDRLGHNGRSWTPFPILVQFLLLLSSLPSTASMTDCHRHNGQSRVQLLEYGYWDYFSELHDKPTRRTIIDTTDRHKLRNPTLGQTSPSSFSSCTTLPPTDRHKHDGPS